MSPLRSKEVLELGARLVEQLDSKDDLLASWMAHYIAELIENVEKATVETKRAAQEVCAKAILELWRHRSSLPKDVRPFAKLGPVLRTLASLDNERTLRRYYARERDDAEASADEEMRKWLDFARDIDDAARFLIRTAIRSAVAGSVASMTPWIELAKSAELDNNVEYSVLKFVQKAYESGDEARERQAALRFSLARIESFLKAGAAFADVVRAYIVDENGGVPLTDDEGEGEDGDEDTDGDGAPQKVDESDDSEGNEGQ